MTELNKPVRRRTALLMDNRLKPRSKDIITVTLYPDQSIGFRQHGRRKEYILPLATCYRLAILETEREEKRLKAKRRKRKS